MELDFRKKKACCGFNNTITTFRAGIQDECVKQSQVNLLCACLLFCIRFS